MTPVGAAGYGFRGINASPVETVFVSYILQQGKSGQLVTTVQEVGTHILIQPESALVGNTAFHNCFAIAFLRQKETEEERAVHPRYTQASHTN